MYRALSYLGTGAPSGKRGCASGHGPGTHWGIMIPGGSLPVGGLAARGVAAPVGCRKGLCRDRVNGVSGGDIWGFLIGFDFEFRIWDFFYIRGGVRVACWPYGHLMHVGGFVIMVLCLFALWSADVKAAHLRARAAHG